MSSTPSLATATWRSLGDGHWLIAVRCPYCRTRSGRPKVHTHGGGGGEKPVGGTRLAHCASVFDGPGRQYELDVDRRDAQLARSLAAARLRRDRNQAERDYLANRGTVEGFDAWWSTEGLALRARRREWLEEQRQRKGKPRANGA